MISEEQIQRKILEKLDLSKDIEDEELKELIFRVLEEESEKEYLSLSQRAIYGTRLFNSFRKLDLLQEFIEDESITEIMINGTDNIFVEKKGKMYLTDKKFVSKDKLEDVIQQIVAGTNRRVNEASPIVDSRLMDGSRVHVVLPPVALNGPIVTIRKFEKDKMDMDEMIALKSISVDLAEAMKKLVVSGYNIFISGGTGSGKTTFLNVLSQFIPRDERIITIEDTAELCIQNVPNLVRLETRDPNIEGEGGITIRDLIKAALRMRPTRIIVGEVRGAEAIDMIQAMSTGHKGSLSTGHSDSPRDMLQRLETMVLLGGENLPLKAVQRQIASAVDIMIHVGRMRDGSRKVLEVTEVLDFDGNEIQTEVLYRYEEGQWKKIHDLRNREKLLLAGYQTF